MVLTFLVQGCHSFYKNRQKKKGRKEGWVNISDDDDVMTSARKKSRTILLFSLFFFSSLLLLLLFVVVVVIAALVVFRILSFLKIKYGISFSLSLSPPYLHIIYPSSLLLLPLHFFFRKPAKDA